MSNSKKQMNMLKNNLKRNALGIPKTAAMTTAANGDVMFRDANNFSGTISGGEVRHKMNENKTMIDRTEKNYRDHPKALNVYCVLNHE